MSGYGENGLAIYSDKNKKLYILVIQNIRYDTGMVYFKEYPAYRIVFSPEGNRKVIQIDKSPAKGYMMTKLPGFVNKSKVQNINQDIPGLFDPKKEKNPTGGFPKLFETTKDIMYLQHLSKNEYFNKWFNENKEKYNLQTVVNLRTEIRKIIQKLLN